MRCSAAGTVAATMKWSAMAPMPWRAPHRITEASKPGRCSRPPTRWAVHLSSAAVIRADLCAVDGGCQSASQRFSRSSFHAVLRSGVRRRASASRISALPSRVARPNASSIASLCDSRLSARTDAIHSLACRAAHWRSKRSRRAWASSALCTVCSGPTQDVKCPAATAVAAVSQSDSWGRPLIIIVGNQRRQ